MSLDMRTFSLGVFHEVAVNFLAELPHLGASLGWTSKRAHPHG